MATMRLGSVIRQLLRAAGSKSGLSDEQLLDRFIARRDEAAFEALVWRHGPTVMGVCERLLNNSHDAEDAFQATFLVLVRKAASISKRQSLGSWLHKVAHRTATKARRVARSESSKGVRVASVETTTPFEDSGRATQPEIIQLRLTLHEELSQLREKHRAPLILCYLEGKTHEEAAQQLGLKKRTLKAHLDQARALLRRRLTRRGVTLTASGLAAALAQEAAAAAVHTPLVIATVEAAKAFAMGKVSGAAVAASTIALAEGVLKGMVISKMKLVATVVVAFGVVGTGVGVATYRTLGGENAAVAKSSLPNPVADSDTKSERNKEEKVRTDQYGDPLPEGAIARLGTVRFRHGLYVQKLVYSPDGKQLASSSYDGTLRIWDTAMGKELHRLPGSRQFSYSANGKILTAAAGSRGVGQWDTATGLELISPSKQDRDDGFCLAISPDHKLAVYGTFSPAILRVRDIATDRLIHEVRLPDGAGMGSAAFTPDSRLLAVQGLEKADRQVRIVDVNTGKIIKQLDTEKGNDYNSGPFLAIDSKGVYLAALTKQTSVRVWDLKTFKQVSEFAAEPSPIDMNFAPGSSRLVTICMRGIVQIFDAATGKEIHKFSAMSSPQAIAAGVSPNGKTVAVGTGGVISFWNMETGKETGPYPGHMPFFYSFRLIDQHRVKTYDGKQLTEWDAYDGCVLRRQPFDVSSGRLIEFAALTRNEKLWYIKDKKDKGLVIFYDAETLKEVRRFATGLRDVHGVWFTPDEQLMIATGHDATVRIWRLPEAKLIFERKVTNKQFREDWAYVFHAFNGRVLATYVSGPDVGFHDDRIRFFEIPSGKELPSLAVDPYFPDAFRFTPDGGKLERFVTCSDNRIVRHYIATFNLATQREHREYLKQSFAGSPSPDNRVFVAYAPTKGLQLLERCSLKVRGTISEHADSAIFSESSDLMATTSSDSTALIWDITGLAHPDFKWISSLPSKALEAHWAALADSDAAKAFASMKTLMAARRPTTALFRDRLRPATAIDEKQVAQLIADLDGDKFETREKAFAGLKNAAEQAESLVTKALLLRRPSPEAKRRLEGLLDELDKPITDPEKLRALRALEVLEHIATPEARDLLKKLAEGAPEARLTQEAKASLERLTKRAPAKP